MPLIAPPLTDRTRRRLRWAAGLWTFGILAACSVPGPNLPPAPDIGLDKVAHLVFFLVFGWLWLLSAPPAATYAAWVALAGTLYAVGTEVYQGTMPLLDRTADPYDALANLIGLSLGVGLASYQRHRQRSHDGLG